MNEQEKINYANLSNQKMKYMEIENEQNKEEINKLNSRITNYISQIDKLKDEVYLQKENTSKKNYEVEKNLLEIKLLNNKIEDLNNTIDKLLKEKTNLDENNNILNKNNLDKINILTNENTQLKKEIEKLNSKINDIMNINISLKESKTIKPNKNNIKRPMDDSVQDAVNFFKNEEIDNFENNDFNLNNNNNIELNNKIKELNLELQRIKEEYSLNEKNYIQEINLLKQQTGNKNEYDQIINNLQEKYNNLEKEYENQKNKIINENKDIINKLKKENQKLKKDKENLIKLCSQLKIEVNRLENNLSMAQNVIEEANTEDILKRAGVAPTDESYLQTRPFKMALSYVLWLIIIAIINTFSSIIISKSESLLETFALLVVFFPVLNDTGGNSGNQTTSTITRALATNEITLKDFFKVTGKELVVGFLTALLVGTFNFAWVQFEFHTRLIDSDRDSLISIFGSLNTAYLIIGLIVSLSLVFSITLSKTLGSSLPILAKIFKIDPAVISGPLIACLMDILTLLIYFAIAKGVLNMYSPNILGGIL